MSLNDIIDFILRALTLGGRFVLLISMAKYLSANDVGVYGVFGSLIAYILYFLGIDFYTYSTRNIIDNGLDRLWSLIFNEFIFFAFNYIVFIIFAKFIFDFSGIPEFVFFGVLIAILEHISQEIYRILIAVKKVRAANLQLFIRSGGWCYVVSALLFANVITNLHEILKVWIVFGSISALLGFEIIYLTVRPRKKDFIFDITWIQKGLKVSAFLFIGTMCLRGVFYFDKILLQKFVSFDLIGIYVFYFGIAAAIQSFVDILVVSRYFPDLMRQINIDIKVGNMTRSKVLLDTFRKKIIITTIFLSAISIPACYLLILILDKAEYVNNFPIYLSLLISNIILLMSMPYHYFLYAIKCDKLLVLTNIATFLVFMLMSYVLISTTSGLAVYLIIFSIIVAYLVALLIKYKSYRAFIKVYS